MIQGNIAQTDKWNPARAGMILDRYLQLSRQAVENGAQFLIWPESSTPFYFDEDPAGEADSPDGPRAARASAAGQR